MLQLLIPILGSVLDKIFPDKTKADEAKVKLLELQMNGELQQIVGQLEVNKEEAKNMNLFVSGWRPSIGWVCSSALAYEFLGRPLLTFISAQLGSPVEAPDLPMGDLMTILLGMLGLGTLRTMEKLKDKA